MNESTACLAAALEVEDSILGYVVNATQYNIETRRCRIDREK